MGWGDELIATGQARRAQEEHGAPVRKVFIRDRNGAIRKHDMWLNNPRIAGRSENVHKAIDITNGPSVRPYIAAKTEQRWTWREWECPVGEIYFSADELEFARAHSAQPDLVIEPTLKGKASPNKDWGASRWQALVDLARAAGFKVHQLGTADTQVLKGAKLIETPSFRHACAVLARARVAVLPEGGLHHSAAALGVKTVVIFGGYIGPKQTGYATQTNLFTGGEACGMRVKCPHCTKAMAEIEPERVMAEVLKL